MKMKKVVTFSIITIVIFSLVVAFQGCGEKEPEVIKFGAILSLTGDAASYGTMMKNGMDIAVDEINSSGGIDGKNVQVKYEDSQFIPKNAVSIAQKLIEVDNIRVITGITGSKNALAVASLTNSKGVVVIDALSSSANLTSEGGEYYFRIMPSDNFSGAFVAEWATSNGWNSAAIIYANDDWGTAIRDAAKDKYESLGGKVSISEAVEPNSKDFKTILLKLKSKNPDVIFLFAYAPEAGIIVKQSKELNINTHFIGSDNLSAGEFVNVGGSIVEGVMFALPAEGSGKTYQEFQSKYKNRFGEDPSINSINSYDVVKLAAFAVSKVGYHPNKIKDFLLSQLSNYYGASGKIEFDQNGDIKNPEYEKMIYHNGMYTKVDDKVEDTNAN